jgi:hypothetical protein
MDSDVFRFEVKVGLSGSLLKRILKKNDFEKYDFESEKLFIQYEATYVLHSKSMCPRVVDSADTSAVQYM